MNLKAYFLKPLGTCPANAVKTGNIPNDLMSSNICFCNAMVALCHELVNGPPKPRILPIRSLKKLAKSKKRFKIDSF